MHRLEGYYQDASGGYGCTIKVEGGEPYILLNLEKYWSQSRLDGEHCDFLYICEKNNKYYIFIVELKDIEDKNLIEETKKRRELQQTLKNKFRNTIIKLDGDNGILSILSANKRNHEIIGIFVVPREIVSLIKRKKMHFIIESFNDFRIVGCDESSIWSR